MECRADLPGNARDGGHVITSNFQCTLFNKATCKMVNHDVGGCVIVVCFSPLFCSFLVLSLDVVGML